MPGTSPTKIPAETTIVTIIGLGLIGSSVAKALDLYCKRQMLRYGQQSYGLRGYDRSLAIMRSAKLTGIIDTDFNSDIDAVQGAHIVMICTPLGAYQDIIVRIAPYLANNCIVTDVGSVKSTTNKLILQALGAGRAAYFVGAHPIAGSEQTGFAAGSEQLFHNRPVFITKTAGQNHQAVRQVVQLWHDCGAMVQFIAADQHDQIYAQVSHIQHLIAFCYKLFVNSSHVGQKLLNQPLIQQYFGLFMRISNSSGAIWADIFIHNRLHLLQHIQRFTDRLQLYQNNFCRQELDWLQLNIEPIVEVVGAPS